MKFFRQTKETKRKLSFFLALAMVISLLPVSPVAKAAGKGNVTFHCYISGMKITKVKDETSVNTTSGTAIVTLETLESGKSGKITGLVVGISKPNSEPTSTSTTAITLSGSAVSDTNNLNPAYNPGEVTVNNGTASITITNITKAGNIYITGNFEPTQSDTTTTPGDNNPGGNTPGGDKPTTPDTPPTVSTGSVIGDAVDEIGEDVTVEVSAEVADGSVDKNIKADDVVGNYTVEGVKEAVKKGTAIVETSLQVSMPNDTKQKEEKDNVTAKGKDNIKNLDSSKIDKTSFDKMVSDGVVLNIDLLSVIRDKNNQNATMASIKMEELNGEVKVTIQIPNSLTEKYKNQEAKGEYYVIRIHNNEMTIIQCVKNGNGTISFTSDKFSTYIVTFKEGESIVGSKPTITPSPGNNNGYIPGPGQSTAPSANPSTAPSTNPSVAPSTNPSVAPSANPSGAPTDPTNAPSDPTNAPADPTKAPGTSTSVKVGKKATISGSQYKVTAVKGTRTVQFTKGKKNAKKIVIPSTVKVSGKSYKVTTIAKNALKGNKKLTKLTIGANVKKIGANAFRGCSKLKSIIVKTKKLTKSKVGANAFKGINAKATVKVPKAKVKAYKKIVKAKGAGKNVKVKK